MEFPVKQSQYSKIERQNNINVNVFDYVERQPFPVYLSRESNEDTLNVLLITLRTNKSLQ